MGKLFYEALMGASIWKKNIECNSKSLVLIVQKGAEELFKILYDELDNYMNEHRDKYDDILIISNSKINIIKKKNISYVHISSKEMRELIAYSLLTSKPTGNLMRRNVRIICPELFLGGQFNKLLENNVYPVQILIKHYLLYAEIE